MKKIILIMLMVTWLASLASAAWTNSYDQLTKTYTLYNNGNPKATLTLLDNTANCGGDMDCYAKIQVTLLENWNNGFNQWKFKDMKTLQDRNDIFKKLKKNDQDYDDNDLIGTFTLTLIGSKNNDDVIDWIPIVKGMELSQWAIWGSQTTYDDFEDSSINWNKWINSTSGWDASWDEGVTTTGALHGGCSWPNAGKSCVLQLYTNSSSFPNFYGIENLSINLTTSLTMASGCSNQYAKFFIFGTDNIIYNTISSITQNHIWTAIRNHTSGNFDVYKDDIFNVSISPSGLLQDKFGVMLNGVFGAGCTGGSAYTDLYYSYYTINNKTMNISLNYPVANSIYPINSQIKFNISANTTNAHLKNISLYLDSKFNLSSAWNGTINNSLFYQNVTTLGSHNFSANVCDEDGNCLNSDPMFFWMFPFSYSGNFSTPVMEGSSTIINLNISYNSSAYQSVSATLIYNNTLYSTTKIGTGDNITFTRSIITPAVSAHINKTLYWQIALANETATSYFNTSNYLQQVNNLALDNCSVNTVHIINYTAYDEKLLSLITGATNNLSLEVTTYLYTDEIGNGASTSFNTSQVNPISVCVASMDDTVSYKLWSVIKYSSFNRETEYYALYETGVNNNTIPYLIKLYDLTTADSQECLITVKDSNYLPISNAIIRIDREYLGEGVFKTVEAPYTDSNGETLGHLELGDAIYNIYAYKDGTLIAAYTKRRAVLNAAGDCIINLQEQQGSTSLPDMQNYSGIYVMSSYNKTTRLYTVDFISTSDTGRTVSFNMTVFSNNENESICYRELFGVSGTLQCTIPSIYENVTAHVMVYVDGNAYAQEYIEISPQYGSIGPAKYILVAVILLTIPLMGLASPVVAGVLFIVGFICSVGLLIGEGGWFGATSVILWLIFAVGIIVLRRSKQA